MNDSIVDEPQPSSSTVMAGSFLKKLQMRTQKLLQRTMVSFPASVIENQVDESECYLPRRFEYPSGPGSHVQRPANQVLQIHWDVDLHALRRLFRHYNNGSELGGSNSDCEWARVVNHEVIMAGGSKLGAAGDELVLIAPRLMTQKDVQQTIDWTLNDVNSSDPLPDGKLVHRPPAQRKSASESEWFVHVTLRVHELTLLTRREKEVLQRRPALLQLVRDYCLEVTALESFELDGNRRPFEQKERYRAEAIANEPHRLAGLQRDRERLARLRALRAEREAALLSQALECKDEIMSPAMDDSGVTPLCSSLAS